ncbi:hypothetical protein ACE6H2_007013 [Prunus campanulata]
MPLNFGISFRHKRERWKMLKRSHIRSYGMFNYFWLQVNGASSMVFEVIIIVLGLSREL